MINIKSKREIECMREAGRIVAEALQLVADSLKAGLTTRELDKAVERLILERGGDPIFKGQPHPRYGRMLAFPASICASINEEVVHGIPNDRVLKEGDVLSVDVGVRIKGYIADGAATFGVGRISKDAARLIAVCKESLMRGIGAARSGARVSDIGRAIQTYVEGEGFSVVRDYTGHGVGRSLWEDPRIPNFVDESMRIDDILRPGMTIAIEPMINAGGWRTREGRNKWTVLTADGSLSAHFEHTIAITEGEADILTVLD